MTAGPGGTNADVALDGFARDDFAPDDFAPGDFASDDWGPRPEPARRERNVDTIAFLTVGLLCALTATALAVTVPNYPSFSNLMSVLPLSVPGVNTDLGVTVLSRYQPDFNQEPMRSGSFIFTPQASQGVTYDDNVLGYRGGPGSWISDTNASIGVNSDWSRDKVGAFVGVDHGQYFNLPKDTRTDVTAAIGGALTLGSNDLDVAYSHLSLHQDPTQIGAIQASTPVPFSVEDFRADYSYDLGSLTLTPSVDFSMWRYGHAVIGGVDSDQSSLNRDVVQGGIAAKYQTGELWNVLFTLAGINAHYTRPQPGVPSPDSTSFVAMGGFDYQFTGNFKARVLAGLEGREFASSAYKSRLTPVGEADVVWTPTGVTSVMATLARSIEDPTVSGTTGFTYTRGEIEVDHELRRNIVLRGRIGAGVAEYLEQGATQVAVYGGLGMTWLINRSLQLIVDYQLSSQTGGAPNTTPRTAAPTGHYIRDIGSVRLRVAL